MKIRPLAILLTMLASWINVYVLIAIIKKELQLQQSLAEILQILSITLFEKVPLQQALTKIPMQNEIKQNCNQLSLFNL